MGEEVKSFEKDLSRFFGRDAVCVVNGTSALQLSIQAAGIGLGDEVLVPSITFIAPINETIRTLESILSELSKQVAIALKENEVQDVMIEELKLSTNNPLSN